MRTITSYPQHKTLTVQTIWGFENDENIPRVDILTLLVGTFLGLKESELDALLVEILERGFRSLLEERRFHNLANLTHEDLWGVAAECSLEGLADKQSNGLEQLILNRVTKVTLHDVPSVDFSEYELPLVHPLLGQLVIHIERKELGIGKIISVNEDFIEVGYFDSPVNPIVMVDQVGPSLLRRIVLPNQSRVYLQIDEVWHHGRTVGAEPDKDLYGVRLPNDPKAFEIKGASLYVRWEKNPDCPTKLLASMVWETPLFHWYRHQFVRSLIQQRHYTMGMDGYISSKISLAQFQFRSIWRILQDPVQRYLIGDEVGLGKTVIASVVVRQHILDDPQARVLFVVPGHLIPQWEQELRCKFSLSSWLDQKKENDLRSVKLAALEDLSAIKELVRNESFTFVVIDEAHHLARYAWENEKDSVSFQVFQQLCHGSPRLLLLTATPVLRNEDGFLAMLNLLDPMIYALAERDRFKQSIAAREQVAKLCYNLKNYGLQKYSHFRLNKRIEFSDYLLEDPYLNQRLGQFKKQGFPKEGLTEAQKEDLNQAYLYLLERHRLHRRILRTRRPRSQKLQMDEDAEHQLFSHFLTGRSGVEIIQNSNDALVELDQNLNEWLHHAPTEVAAWQAFYIRCVELSWQDLRVLRALLSARLTDSISDLENWAPESASELTRLLREAPPLGPGEKVFLSNLLKTFPDPEQVLQQKFESLLEALKQEKNWQRFVVFCHFPCTADWLAMAIQESGKNIHRITSSQPESCCDTTTSSFAQIYICDSRAEEGQNLQSKKKSVVVHFDLLLNPNRLEQRIGRCDRFNGGKVKSWVLAEFGPNSIQSMYLDLLNEIEIFDYSSSILQYWLQENFGRLSVALATLGHDAFEQVQSAGFNKEGMRRELQRIQRHEVFEQGLDDVGDRLIQTRFDTLVEEPEDDFDKDTKMRNDLYGAAFQWLKKMNFQLQPIYPEQEEKRSTPPPIFQMTYRPSKKHHTLLPLNRALSYFPSLARKQRSLRLTNHGREELCTHCARKYRELRENNEAFHALDMAYIGTELVEGLRRWMRWDDRGQSFGMWRWEPGLPDEYHQLMVLRFDVIIEADMEPLHAMIHRWKGTWEVEQVNEDAVRRRADFWFPPTLKTFFIRLDTWNFVQEDDDLYDWIVEDYEKHKKNGHYGDININYKRLNELMLKLEEMRFKDLMLRWEDTIETGRNLVDEKVQELKAVVHLQQRSIKHLQRYGQELRVQFEARQPGMNEVSDGLKRVEEMYQEFELTLVDELIQSIENFQHRIDSAGVMILTMDLPTTI